MSMDADQVEQETERDRALIARALAGSLTSAYQPIVDLGQGAVLGYQALLRYRSDTTTGNVFSAAELFASARRIGRLEDVEAAALTAALRARDELPGNCHMFLKVAVRSLADERVERVLRAQGDLQGVVLELSEDVAGDIDQVRDTIELFRDRGSRIAVVDPHLDAHRMDALMLIEPGYFKLDRKLVSGVAASNTKLALVDSLRYLADRLGVGVIAQGIEDLADLRSLERLGIGFGQGYLLARPSTDRRFATSLRSLTPGRTSAAGLSPDTARPTLGRLIESVCELTESELDQPLTNASGAIEFEVLVTEMREPMALLRRAGRRVESLSLTIIDETASIQEAVRTAMRRPRTTRFEPLVCVDSLGACAGVVRIERLLELLAAMEASPRAFAPGSDSHRNRHAFDFSCRPPHRHRGR